MEYQLRIGIRTNLISDCDIDFIHKGMTFRFLLKEKGKRQKLYVIVDASDWQEAIRYFWRNLARVFDKFILYTGERVESIWYPEIILENECGKSDRILRYHDIITQTGHSFYQSQINNLKLLLETDIEDRDLYVISYLRLAIESYSYRDKYLNTYKAAEKIYNQVKREEKNTKSKSEFFESTFSISPYENPRDSLLSIDWKKVIDLRNKCAHAHNEGKVNIAAIDDMMWDVFKRVENYLVNKYFRSRGMDSISPGPSMGPGLGRGYEEYSFTTNYPSEIFAPDAPSLDEIRAKLGER